MSSLIAPWLKQVSIFTSLFQGVPSKPVPGAAIGLLVKRYRRPNAEIISERDKWQGRRQNPLAMGLLNSCEENVISLVLGKMRGVIGIKAEINHKEG